MERMALQLGMFETLALAVLAIYLGNFLRKVFPVLKKYCLPASVVGGTIFAAISLILYYSNVAELTFEFKAVNSLFYCIFFAASGAAASLSLIKERWKTSCHFCCFSSSFSSMSKCYSTVCW